MYLDLEEERAIEFFCCSYKDIDGIFEEEATSALVVINYDPVMSIDLKVKGSLIANS